MSFYYGYTAPHAPPVEFGTGPHWAPPVPIYEWCRRQLQKSGRKMDNTQEDIEHLFSLLSSKRNKRLSAAEKAFIGVYKKIGTQGTEEHPFMRPSIEVIQVEGLSLIQEGYAR